MHAAPFWYHQISIYPISSDLLCKQRFSMIFQTKAYMSASTAALSVLVVKLPVNLHSALAGERKRVRKG